MLKEQLAKLDEIRDRLEDFEPKTDAQALLSVEMHNALARARQILAALSNEVGAD